MSTKELKLQLKALAEQIATAKNECKNYQREHGGWDGGHYRTIELLKYDYRHTHIAYCQLRGRKYEEIERHCGDNNHPNWTHVKEIMDAHQEKAAEAVCLGA